MPSTTAKLTERKVYNPSVPERPAANITDADGKEVSMDVLGARYFLPTNGAPVGRRRGSEAGLTIADTGAFLAWVPTQKETNTMARRVAMDVTTESEIQRRKTRIICTIGPGTKSPESLYALRMAGMDVMRMNFSHGTHEYHAGVIANLKASYDLGPGPDVAIALDTKGPEIRTGQFANGKEILETNAMVTITTDAKRSADGDAKCFWVTYENMAKVVDVGKKIFIDDGLLELEVVTVDPNQVFLECKVLNGGEISNNKGVNLPGTDVDLPTLSEKDKADLKFGVENQVDMVFASFIRDAKGVNEIRDFLGEAGARIKIIAKIENQQGLDNINDILHVSDGVMVARGDMGIEIPPWRVFIAQKMMIARANLLGKPCICATQMLETMRKNPRPTRAEASDVANAVMDGADCVMLSGETASGMYPVETVEMMAKICVEAETLQRDGYHFKNMNRLYTSYDSAMGHRRLETLASAAVQASFDRKASAILCFSQNGTTPPTIAKFRPDCPIIVVTSSAAVARDCQILRGVIPYRVPPVANDANFGDNVLKVLHEAIEVMKVPSVNILQTGDRVVLMHGDVKGRTDTLRLLHA
jgi:pyruvate kinase